MTLFTCIEVLSKAFHAVKAVQFWNVVKLQVHKIPSKQGLVKGKTYFVIEKNGETEGCGKLSTPKTYFGGIQFSVRKVSESFEP
jgi:hypothetical protein